MTSGGGPGSRGARKRCKGRGNAWKYGCAILKSRENDGTSPYPQITHRFLGVPHRHTAGAREPGSPTFNSEAVVEELINGLTPGIAERPQHVRPHAEMDGTS